MSSTDVDNSLTACLSGEIANFVRSFTETDLAGKQSLLQLYTVDAPAFCDAAMPVLAANGVTPGSRYVVHLLLKEDLLMRALTDPDQCHRSEALAVVRHVGAMGSVLEAELERALSANLKIGPGPSTDGRVLRLLDLMEAARAERRCLLFQGELLGSPNTQIRRRAALVIARNSRTVSLAGRLMLDSDVDIQANAVEALWSFDAAEAAPLLMTASKSRVPRVVGNAAVGLYRLGDLGSIRLLWQMVARDELAFREAGIRAMGETGDARFMPYLTELYKSGTSRATVMGALARIRGSQKLAGSPSPVEIRVHAVEVDADSNRKVLFGMWGEGLDLSGIRPIHFSVSEDDAAATEYSVTAQSNSAVLMVSFILPRASSIEAEYRTAAIEAIERCVRYKRDDDLWRIDRYCSKVRVAASERGKSPLPYDETLGGPTVKALRGFVTERERIAKILSTEGAKEQAAHDLPAALDRVAEAMEHISGSRHIFLFGSPDDASHGLRPDWARQYAQSLEDQRIRLYTIAPEGLDWNGDETLSALGSMGCCTILRPVEEAIGDVVEQVYARLLNQFELRYRAQGNGRNGKIALYSAKAQGAAEFQVGAA